MELNPAALKIQQLFTIFEQLYQEEDECVVIVQKSVYTQQITDANVRRNTTFRGLADSVNTALKHFNPDIVESARRLKILFDTYGNIAQLSSDAETSTIYNLIQELQGKYAGDAAKIGINDWIDELQSNNNTYIELLQIRTIETSQKTKGTLREIRPKIDELYRKITQSIEVFTWLVQDEKSAAACNNFIKQFNPVIQRYKNLLAQRKGFRQAKKEEKSND